MKQRYLGINIVPKFVIDFDKTLKNLNKLRCSWIRLEFDYYLFFENNLEFENIDKICKFAKQHNIKILGVLSGKVPGNLDNLINPSKKYPYILDNIDSYKKFLDFIVTRYKSVINHWEIWNEQNSLRFWIKKPNPLKYSKLLEISSKYIKNIQKNAIIVFGGIMGDDQTKLIFGQYLNFFKDFVIQSKGVNFDISNFHPYDINCYVSLKSKNNLKKHFIKLFKKNIEYAKSISDKPIFFSEFGISRKYVRLSEKDIARIYVSLLKECTKNKVVIFLWTLVGPYGNQYSIFNPETSFNLLNKDGSTTKTFECFVKEININ